MAGGVFSTIIAMVPIILLILNIILSIRAGNNYAKLVHDSRLLAERAGRGLSGLAYLPFIMILIGIILINIFYMIFVKMFTIFLKVFLNTLLGLALNPAFPLVVSAVLIPASFLYYNRKYKSVDRPLTIYAKTMLASIEKPRKVIDKFRKRFKAG